MLKDVYYHLYKDWGRTVVLYTVGKGDLNIDDGTRSTTLDKSTTTPCIVCPEKTMWKFLKGGQLPDKIRTFTSFLFLTSDLPDLQIEFDYIKFEGKEFKHLERKDYDGVLTILSGESR